MRFSKWLSILHTLYTSYPTNKRILHHYRTMQKDKMIESFFSFREKLKNRVSSIIITSLAKYSHWLSHKKSTSCIEIFNSTYHTIFLLARKVVGVQRKHWALLQVRTQFSCLFIFRHTSHWRCVTSKVSFDVMCNNYQLYLHYYTPNANTLTRLHSHSKKKRKRFEKYQGIKIESIVISHWNRSSNSKTCAHA